MYRRLFPVKNSVNFSFEGQLITAEAGESVAAALLAANVGSFRDTPVSESLRAPFCMMGTCFDCLVTIDDLPNRQACLTEVQEGMVVLRQKGAA
ncbi:(2Fe-2S)-binding protein [Kordiimonas sp.]|uniref:(2Fe-2S)-binding protein n=1 Tax=Kordiimonas sp. TaxID=1970157 RepID=UPI003A8FCD1A